MDDLKVILWIVIGLIYLFARKKKKEPEPQRRSRPVDQEEVQEEPRPVPKTFEELLREIEGTKQPVPAPMARKPEPVVVDYDEEIPSQREDYDENIPDYRKDYQKEDQIYQVYEQAKAQAFSRPSLEETVKLEDTIVRFKQFKGYEKDTRRTDVGAILKEFRDPQGFKKAFIMSEILKPKF